ncbi:unnamed protein product [Nezara viridula]|uniref:Uncharacterized protein n=1 Tax=Nezara viridula TaxID=85310 RepID=A0A9P0EFQ2_NEZVI|nr:unnamed protein product [Nezara viridula]
MPSSSIRTKADNLVGCDQGFLRANPRQRRTLECSFGTTAELTWHCELERNSAGKPNDCQQTEYHLEASNRFQNIDLIVFCGCFNSFSQKWCFVVPSKQTPYQTITEEG